MAKVGEVIINLAKMLGYLHEGAKPDDGLCHGFSVAWMNACLIGQDRVFDKRINYLLASRAENIVRKMDELREKIRTKGSHDLSIEEKELLEILGFYENVLIHQFPEDYFDLLASDLKQLDIVKISPFSEAKQLEEEGGIQQIYSQFTIFSSTDHLVDYLEKLAIRINSVHPPVEGNVGFILAGIKHTIALKYNSKEREATYMDINHWPPKATKSVHTLACHIRETGSYFTNSSEQTYFNIQLFSTAKNAERLTHAFHGFRGENKLSKENQLRLDASAISIIVSDDPEAALELASSDQAFELFNTRNPWTDLTPMHLAIIEGNSDLIRTIVTSMDPIYVNELMTKKSTSGLSCVHFIAETLHASLSQMIYALPGGLGWLKEKGPQGMTLAHLAAKNGNSVIIKAIGELPCGMELLSQKSFMGYSCVNLASKKGNDDVIRTIGQLPFGFELLRVKCSRIGTTAHLAASLGYASVIKALAGLPYGLKLLSEKNEEGSTPVLIAYENHHFDVIDAIADLPQGEGFIPLYTPNSYGERLTYFLIERYPGHCEKVDLINRLMSKPFAYQLFSRPCWGKLSTLDILFKKDLMACKLAAKIILNEIEKLTTIPSMITTSPVARAGDALKFWDTAGPSGDVQEDKIEFVMKMQQEILGEQSIEKMRIKIQLLMADLETLQSVTSTIKADDKDELHKPAI